MAKLPPALSKYFSEMGKKGGKIGGRRRAELMTPAERKRSAMKAAKAAKAAILKLTPAERTARAKKAALARWEKKKKEKSNP